MYNKNEIWTQWQPHKDIYGAFFIQKIYNNIEALKIILLSEREKNKKVLLTFDNTVAAYRNIEEGFILKTSPTFLKSDRKSMLEKPWTFFYVENSDFLAKTKGAKKSKQNERLHHFGFFSINFILDVLSINEPEIKIIYN